MNRVNIRYHKSKIGELVLGAFDSKLCLLDFRYRKMRKTVDTRIKSGLKAEFIEQDDDILQATVSQIDEYLSASRSVFDIPILTVGTDFQKAVWTALMTVSYGETSTYSQIARVIGNTKSVRAVAGANGANAIALIIPCHRIIGSDGQLTGYGGGVSVKKRLLDLEQSNNPSADLCAKTSEMQPTQKSFVFSDGKNRC